MMFKLFNVWRLTFLIGGLCGASACGYLSASNRAANDAPNQNGARQSAKYGEPRRIAALKDEAIGESSGLAASQKNPGAFWTINDSDAGAFLFAFDRTGKKLGTWRVPNAKNYDWEDLALFVDPKTAESYLLIGDIGDNARKRQNATIYRVVEPEIQAADAASTKKNPRLTQNAEAIRVEYPAGARDAETLVVNPANGDIYIVSKNLVGNAEVYKVSAPDGSTQKSRLQRIAEIGVPSITPGFLSGGAISPDGKRLALTDYFAIYEFELPARAQSFDEIWTVQPDRIEAGERAQGEAVTYAADNSALYATSEKRPTPLIEIKRR